ncbi:extracellular solute-binding protein [Streptomyces candidus]|uniref:Putative aldouronate transport system substrate-binding protein n=1 Tax=Streptomyces candidus TaxID=67283 RepID=A0A7X0HJR2_9ACTN|nr:extracellular solute-binding protein [Streptomyces candidus]MBB6438947.1 putative aldouronate transport system substrate-binding protein [Streptomyces candidus]GHH44362.1 lipoprotein [Streptomyces candidus]
MTPNTSPAPRVPDAPAAPEATGSPRRRTFLSSSALAAVAVAGGLPLLSACNNAKDGKREEGATTGKNAKALLPTYVALNLVAPDIPSKNGSPVGFTQSIPSSALKTAVPEKLGKGSTFKIMAPFWGSPPAADNPYYRAVNEAAGVRAVFQNQDGNVYADKLGAVLASSTIPDVVVIPAWNLTGKIPTAVNAKFEDLGPYLSGDKVKKYPNLAAVPTDAWQRSIFGGVLRGVPMPASNVINIVPYYRKDIFDAKGYQLPESADEFLSFAKDITAAKSKVWACDDMKWASFSIFGVLSGGDKALMWDMVDGKLVHRVETPQFLEALEWTRKLYASGVVHPDARVKNQGDAGNRFTAGQSLIYTQDISHWYAKTAEQRLQNPEFAMGAMDYFHHDGGDPKLYAVQPASIWTFIRKGAPKAMVEDFLALANFCASPYGSKERRLTEYGVEGVHYTLTKGEAVKTEKGNLEVNGAFDYTGDPAVFIAHPDLPEVAKGQLEWLQRMGSFTRKSAFYGLTVTEPNRWATLDADFETLEDDVVRGRRKVADMQQAVADWKSKGGDKLRDWYRKLLDDTGAARG